MQRLTVHRADPAPNPTVNASAVEPDRCQAAPNTTLTPLLIDIDGLAALLARSVPSLHRDDAAGRLPAALRIGGSKRWRYADIVVWVELGCPARAEFETRRKAR
jgi:predicted DNA-binding transcriptional regulator AlpA